MNASRRTLEDRCKLLKLVIKITSLRSFELNMKIVGI